MQSSPASIINSPATSPAFLRFDKQKEMEIIVWIRQLQNKDKQQITEDVIQKFNTSKEDAERLYYEAYPDGLSSQEEELLSFFEEVLPQDNQEDVVDRTIMIVLDPTSNSIMNHPDMDIETSDLFYDLMNTMMQQRQIVQP